MDEYNALCSRIERVIRVIENYKTTDPSKYRDCMEIMEHAKDALNLSKKAIEQTEECNAEVKLLEEKVKITRQMIRTLINRLDE
jgi:hypothetical protein